MTVRVQRTVPSVIGAVIVALLLTLTGGFISAQENDDLYDVGIIALNCLESPQGVDRHLAFRQPTEVCDPGAGISVTVTDAETGEELGSCVTDVADVPEPVTAGCTVAVPFGALIVATEDVPAGYVPERNPVAFTAPDAPPDGIVGGPTFVNVLQDGSGDLVQRLVTVLIGILQFILNG